MSTSAIYVTRSTYLLHQSETVFSRKQTVKPPLASQQLPLCKLATVALKAAVLRQALTWPVSKGEGEKAHRNTTALPPGAISLEKHKINVKIKR